MSSEFKLNDQEAKEAKLWFESHNKTCEYLKEHSYETYKGIPATGGRYYYKFTPTGLGNCVEVGCNFCGENKDITDVSC